VKNEDLAVLGVRLLGLYALIYAAREFGHLAVLARGNWGGSWSPGISALLALPALSLLAIALVLLFRADRIGLAFAPPAEAAPASPAPADSETLQTMLLATVGLVLVVTALPWIFQSVVSLIIAEREDFGPEMSMHWTRMQVLGRTTQIVLGAVLFSRARPVAAWWHRVRDARYDL
jgi:hypothetical protein